MSINRCCFYSCNRDGRSKRNGVFFVPFPKPKSDMRKSQLWLKASGRLDLQVTDGTYVCSKHFVGGNGPTLQNPNPIPVEVDEPTPQFVIPKTKILETYSRNSPRIKVGASVNNTQGTSVHRENTVLRLSPVLAADIKPDMDDVGAKIVEIPGSVRAKIVPSIKNVLTRIVPDLEEAKIYPEIVNIKTEDVSSDEADAIIKTEQSCNFLDSAKIKVQLIYNKLHNWSCLARENELVVYQVDKTTLSVAVCINISTLATQNGYSYTIKVHNRVIRASHPIHLALPQKMNDITDVIQTLQIIDDYNVCNGIPKDILEQEILAPETQNSQVYCWQKQEVVSNECEGLVRRGSTACEKCCAARTCNGLNLIHSVTKWTSLTRNELLVKLSQSEKDEHLLKSEVCKLKEKLYKEIKKQKPY